MMGRAFQWVRSRRVTVSLVAAAVLAAAGFTGWRHWTGRLLREGEEALAGREFAKARELLARYLSHRPGDADARLLAARAARRMRDFDEALEQLRRCLEDGGSAEAIDIEYQLLKLQRGDDAPVPQLRKRAAWDDALALVVLETLIQYDIDTYRLHQALRDLGAYLERRPDDLQALLGRGFVWERFLYFADALGDYRQAVAAHPNSERARLRLADTLLIVGTPEEALTHYRWLAERWAGRIEVRLGLAQCYRRLGDAGRAQELLDQILGEAPDNGAVLWERGQLALDAQRAAEAEPWLRKAVEALPYDRRVSYSFYRCLLELGRDDEAAAVNARVARLDADVRRLGEVRREVMNRPEDAALRCEGGLLFLRNGEREIGIRWLRLALRFDPTCEAARRALDDAGVSLPP